MPNLQLGRTGPLLLLIASCHTQPIPQVAKPASRPPEPSHAAPGELGFPATESWRTKDGLRVHLLRRPGAPLFAATLALPSMARAPPIAVLVSSLTSRSRALFPASWMTQKAMKPNTMVNAPANAPSNFHFMATRGRRGPD